MYASCICMAAVDSCLVVESWTGMGRRCKAAVMAMDPNSGAVKEERELRNLPMGVRAKDAMTAWLVVMVMVMGVVALRNVRDENCWDIFWNATFLKNRLFVLFFLNCMLLLQKI